MLSGGGSRGLAHVGAMMALQQRGQAPTIVVGTSMGAIIGALYAAGFTPDSIAQVTRKQDWIATFSTVAWVSGPDRLPVQPFVDVRMGGGDARSATGLISDVRANRRLVQLLFDANVRARGDFDRLPRRYRAIAADIISGDAVVLDSGDLARAVRASMSVPGAFSPVVTGERVLVDGGIANYLPISVARDLGARRVFAVDVLRPPAQIQSTSPIALAYRGFRTVLTHTLDASATADYLILPQVPQGLSAAYFPRTPDALFSAGESAALQTVPDTITAAVVTALEFTSLPDSFASIEIESATPAIATLARAALENIVYGAYDPTAIFSAADRLYASELVRGVWPRVEETEDLARPRLVVQVDALPATRFAVAASYDNDRGGRLWSAIRHRLDGAPVELMASGALGSIHRAAAIESRTVFTAVPVLSLSMGAEYRESHLRLFDGDERTGERKVTRAGGWAGLEWRSFARELQASLAVRGDRVHDDGGRDGFAVGPFISLTSTSNASRGVGVPARFEAETRFGEFEYQRARLTGSLDATLRSWRFAVIADLAVAEGHAPPDVLPALGDDHALPGFRWGRERRRTRAVGGVDVAYPIILGGYLRLQLRSAVATDRIAEWNDAAWSTGAALMGIWLTPFGTIGVGTTGNEHGDWRIEVAIGPRF